MYQIDKLVEQIRSIDKESKRLDEDMNILRKKEDELCTAREQLKEEHRRLRNKLMDFIYGKNN